MLSAIGACQLSELAYEAEVSELVVRFGEPARIDAVLDETHRYVLQEGRRAEVCMAIRRPSRKLLAISKPFYANGVFRLPTGGLEAGEGIIQSLDRELWEETGLEVEVTRFLAWIRYTMPGKGASTKETVFNTFAFLLDEVGGSLEVHDEEEPLIFREISIHELLALAEDLDRLPDTPTPEMDDTWRSWGRFRAIAQRVVHDAVLPLGRERP